MENQEKQQLIQKAQELWQTNQAYEASRLIYEQIPRHLRAKWAVNILKFAYPHFPPAPDIEEVIQFGENPSLWSQDNHRDALWIVSTVNRFSRKLPTPFPQLIYLLAANVGKVTYNAQHYPAPFDHTSGWQIGDNLKLITQALNSQEFEENAWKLFCDEHYLQLTQPIICHPACPVCHYNSESILKE